MGVRLDQRGYGGGKDSRGEATYSSQRAELHWSGKGKEKDKGRGVGAGLLRAKERGYDQGQGRHGGYRRGEMGGGNYTRDASGGLGNLAAIAADADAHEFRRFVFEPITAGTGGDFSLITLSCGGAHCAAVTRSGQVYTWGCNSSGQLALGYIRSVT